MRFKPRLRDTVAANVASLRAMGGGAELPADLQRTLDAMPLPKRRKVQPEQTALDIDSVHRKQPRAPDDILEDQIQDEIMRLLHYHPRVFLAVRQNTGKAQYNSKTGESIPVSFYSFIKCPRGNKRITIPDIWGVFTDGRFFTIECKRSLWSYPKTPSDSELRQHNFIEGMSAINCIALFATSAQEVADALK